MGVGVGVDVGAGTDMGVAGMGRGHPECRTGVWRRRGAAAAHRAVLALVATRQARTFPPPPPPPLFPCRVREETRTRCVDARDARVMSAAEMAALGLGAGAEAGQGNAGRAGLALRSREEAANDLGAAVAEWLQFHDLGDTLKALDEEVRRKPLEHSVVNLGGARGAGYGDVERESLLAALTVTFDEGRCGQFFSLWTRGVPAHVRHQSLDAHRAEFYLRVYFAVYPSHPAVPADKRAAVSADGAMGTLREWLATTGAHLAKTSEFVPYYALPYVPDAASHPAFARVFEPAFPSTVRQMALDFFAAAPLVLSAPKLYAYYSAYFGLGQGGGTAGRPASATNGGKRHAAAAAATARPGTAFLEGREGLEAYAPTDADIRSSIRQVAREEGIDPALVDGHDAGGSQKQASARADPHAHMRLRTRTHEDRSRPSTSTHRDAPSDEGAAAMAGAPEATLRRSMPRALGREMEGAAEAQHHQHEVSLGAQLQAELQRQTPGQATASFGAMSAQQQSEAVVDCDATRKTLGEGSARDACDVLQALRLRIARAPPGRARARAALPLALGDALGVLTGAFSRVAVELRSPAASEQLARLADLLAGEPQWRALLADASDDAATCALASLAVGDATSLDFAVTDATRAHALSALQRATLSPRVASAAARAGVVPWTASMLQKLDASDSPTAARSLEYAASLLMNVSLRAEGRRAAADAQAAGADVLGALVDHLESESRAVRAYVNGALYSALRARGVRGAARDIGLGEVLALVAQRSDDVFAAQVRCIALRLERYEVEDAEHEGDGDVGGDDDDDEDDNADYLVEAELASEDGEEGASVEVRAHTRSLHEACGPLRAPSRMHTPDTACVLAHKHRRKST